MDFILKKVDRKEEMELVGNSIHKGQNGFLFVSLLIALFEAGMFVRGLIRFDLTNTRRILYLVSYVILFCASLVITLIILFHKKGKIGTKGLCFAVYFYTSILILWGTLVASLDLIGNSPPIVYLTVVIIIGGLVVLNPWVYTAVTIATYGIILTIGSRSGGVYFDRRGDYINLSVLILMAIFVCFHNYNIALHESRTQKNLRDMSLSDSLTGLGNQAAYLLQTEELQRQIEKEDIPYAVAVMDVNGIKPTNDNIGHRYGTHLIVTAGYTLAEIFTSSHLFHIGGDEFVAIIVGEDLEKLDNRVEQFHNRLEYSTIYLDGIELHLSLGIGVAKHKDSQKYSDVFQEADTLMYQNKAEVKAKYGIASR